MPLKTLRALSFDFLAPRMPDGLTYYNWQLAERVLKRWEAERRGPVLTLPPEVIERGHSTLASAGIPREAWFVAMHVREPTSNLFHASLHSVLNAQIADYLPAIKEITNRGGWVIRMGDPTMSPMPNLPNVFDYCHSAGRSDWMDMFLLACCRFFLGTSSGPAYVPPIYGVPTALTNWWPPAQRPWDTQAIFTPKLHRHMQTGTNLTLSQSLSEPFGYCNSVDQFRDSAQLEVKDSLPDDIRDATIEMIERLEGTVIYSAEDLDLRERAARIYEANSSAHGVGQLARDFLRRNRHYVA